MDGFAVHAASTPGSLRIAGEISIEIVPSRALAVSEAMRIPTGGILPEGADAVVPVESADRDGDFIRVGVAVAAGDSVIARGADMRAGEIVLEPGRRIGSPELAVLATLGVADVRVYRQPIVGIVSCGNELVPVAERPLPGQVRDSNPYAITGSLIALGARPRRYPVVRDREGELGAMLARVLDECDAAIISGGSSVGDRDFTRRTVESLGPPGVVVHGLRIRPGKPALLGARGSKPVIGLPGNPASAFLVLEAVAAPIVAALTGSPAPVEELQVQLGSAVRGREDWTWFVPLAMRDGLAHPLAIHSFATSLAARAAGYLCIGPRCTHYAAGETVGLRRFLSGGAR